MRIHDVYILFIHREKLTDGSFHINEGGLEMIMVSTVASAMFPSWIVVIITKQTCKKE